MKALCLVLFSFDNNKLCLMLILLARSNLIVIVTQPRLPPQKA